MSDNFRISVAIAMSSNHAAILSALSSRLLGVHADVKKLEGGFGRLKTAINGALAIGAGVAMLDMMAKLVEKTKAYQDELIKLKSLGGGIEVGVNSGNITKRAFDIAKRVPMSVTDLAKIPGATNSILGYDDSMLVWEQLAKFQSAMSFQKDYKGDAAADMTKFLRGGELGGRLTDPHTHKAAIEELQRFLDLSFKVMNATHGMVTPSTMLGMTQQAGFSMRGMTDEGFMNMGIIAQAMGGPRAGTALLSMYQQIGSGKMTAATAANMEELGLFKKGDYTTDHGKVIVTADAQRRLGMLMSTNPMNLIDEMLKNLEARGITDPVEQNRLVMGVLGRQTSQRMAGEMMMNHEQINAERGRMNESQGAGGFFDTIMNESVTANLVAVKAAWENLLIAVAGPNSENVIAILKQLTSAIQWMTDAVRGMNPETIRGIGQGLAALAAVLIGAGGAAMFAALGPAGWIVMGLGAIAAAAAKWGPDIFKGIYAGLDSIADALNKFIANLTGMARGLLGIFDGNKGGSFGKDLDDANKSYTPMMFSPGQKTMTAQPIQISMNVDGRSLGEAVTEQLLYLATFGGQAPAANGRSLYQGGDHNTTFGT